LVFTRENRKNFDLFKRPDGKFMTSDCPVERKKKQQLIGAVAICICLIACVVGFLLMMPPSGLVDSDNLFGESAPEPVSSSNWADDPPVSGSKTNATKSGDGVQHYEAGDVLPAEPTSSGMDTSSPAPRSITDSEEKGDFWEFSGP
jgi:hypothetical protein